jgi:hypothetical protein
LMAPLLPARFSSFVVVGRIQLRSRRWSVSLSSLWRVIVWRRRAGPATMQLTNSSSNIMAIFPGTTAGTAANSPVN